MLLINFGIIAGAYISVRIIEHYQKPQTLIRNKSPKLLDTPVIKLKNVAKANQSLQPVKLENVTEHSAAKEIETTHDHYLKTSTAAIGLTLLRHFYPPVTILSIGVIAYSSYPIVKNAETAIKQRRINNDLLTSIVSVLSLGTGEYLASAIQAAVYHFGNKMVTKSQDLSSKMLTNVFEQQPSKVWILKEHQELEVPLETLQIEDIVVVKAGEVIPIDGCITDGMAMIDQHALTGEAVPAEKSIGDSVFAATLMVTGRILVRVEKTGRETTVSKLGEILNHTAEFKTSLQMKGEKWSNQAAMPLISASLISAPLLGISSATAILYSAPVNSIKLFTSLQTFNHLSLVANKGILVKDGRALEELTKIDTVLFDKTGTLTMAELKVGQIMVCDQLDAEELLVYAASAEHRLSHPIAHAIVKQAEQQQLTLLDIEEANYQIGYGIIVQWNDKVIKVGSARFMEAEGIMLPPLIEQWFFDEQQDSSLVMVALNQTVQGAIEICPQLRPEVQQMIAGLRQRGIQRMFIVSGDHRQPTQKLAEALGMDDYFYEVLPQNKAEIVEQLQKDGHRVCFVGDGINDTIAMKTANVSISLRGATSIATDMAQVVFMDGSLSNLCHLFDLSHKLNSNLQNSLLFWAGYGVTNITTSVLFSGIMGSTIFFSVVFGLSMGHAMLPMTQLEHQDKKHAPRSISTRLENA